MDGLCLSVIVFLHVKKQIRDTVSKFHLGAFPVAPKTGLSVASRFRAPALAYAVVAPHPSRSKSAGFATPLTA
jgi:hypothetical protein